MLQLVLGIGNAILWVIEPCWRAKELHHDSQDTSFFSLQIFNPCRMASSERFPWRKLSTS